jgi:hypothetical protein
MRACFGKGAIGEGGTATRNGDKENNDRVEE